MDAPTEQTTVTEPVTAPVTTNTEATPPVVTPPAAEVKIEEVKTEEVKPDFTFADIKLPEGLEVPEEASTKFMELMSKDMTPRERAQALIDLQADVAKQASEKGSAEWVKLQQTWAGEVEADPEIGGANLEQSKSLIGGLLEQFSVEGAREAFDLTGAGNHPAIVKFFVKVAKAMGEGVLVTGQPTASPKTQAQTMFPTMK